MKLLLSKELGYCYGVRDAINDVIALSKEGSVQTWGPLIHNPLAVTELKEKYSISHIESLDNLTSQTLAIRAHGVAPDLMASFEKTSAKLVDATCPFVRKTQNIAKSLMESGYFVIILGKKNHPEVLGIEGYVKNNSLVIQNEEDLAKLTKHKKIGIVFQSTITIDDVGDLIPRIAKFAKELKIYTTICGVTTTRQEEARKISKKVDLMLIIGGKNSSNTNKLKDISKKENTNSIQIEHHSEIDLIDLSNITSIGIVTGTSTPQNIIDDIIKAIKSKSKTPLLTV